MNGQAQPWEQRSHIYTGIDFKNYATSFLPGADKYVMAGTNFSVGGNPGGNGIHFIMVDNTSSTTASKVFNDPAFDERAIDVHYASANEMLVVSSSVSPTAATPNGFQVTRVSGGGSFINNHRIYDPSGNPKDYYPLGSLLYDANTLVICGYQCDYSGTPYIPVWITPKEAFVAVYDLTTNSITAFDSYNWASTGGPDFDYDMAHRLKKMNNGDIWVGGSCGSSTDPLMMNMILSPTLGTPVHDDPIILANSGLAMSSFDRVENLNGTRVDYIFANYFEPFGTSIPTNHLPMFVTITAIQANSSFPALYNTTYNSDCQWQFAGYDYLWGVKALEGNSPNSVVVSGYGNNHTACDLQDVTSWDNVNPYLAELRIGLSASNDIVVTPVFFNTIRSKQGTGNYISDPNNFMRLGGTSSSLLYGPITTVRDRASGIKDFVMSCPVWNGANLNFKYIRTDGSGDIPGCEIVPQCRYSEIVYRVNSTGAGTDATMPHITTVHDLQESNLLWDAMPDCAGGFYKNGSLVQSRAEKGSEEYRLYPNPASGTVQLQMPGLDANAGSVQVLLRDVTGRNIRDLYKGIALEKTELALGDIPAGLYFVIVQRAGITAKPISLSIR